MQPQTNKYAGVLIVIPCLNEETHIERLVLQMVNSEWFRPVSIVIADGGSIDKTRQIAESLAKQFDIVSYLANPKRLQSAGVNAADAIHGQNAEYLIRLDAHASYPENYCQNLIEEAEAIGADSVVVAMETVGDSRFQSAVAAAQNSRLGNGGSAHRCIGRMGCWVDHGHHALMRIDAFNAVSGYDEAFSHNEDAELDIRLAKSGFRIWLTGRTSLQYYPRSAPLPLFQQYVKYGHGRVRTIQKHKVHPKLRQIAPAAVVPASCLMLVGPMAVVAVVPFVTWMLLCLGYGAMLGVRAHRPSIALAGFAALIMHFGWSVGFWQAFFFKASPQANDNVNGDILSKAKPGNMASYIVKADAVCFKVGDQANDIEQANAIALSR